MDDTEPPTIGKHGPSFTREHWIKGGLERLGSSEPEEIGAWVAALLRDTPDLIAIKLSIREGVSITQILEETNENNNPGSCNQD